MNTVAFVMAGEVEPFTAPDGAVITELAGRTTGLISHSVALIAHPAGMSTVEHHHTVADEVYYVVSGAGRVRVDGETRVVGPGDAVIIQPGQRHKLWADGGEDLVLLVTCAPAYDVGEVVWDE
jgi:mannose-6-phosphate isomerase-like protein (cupin superfamily)